MRLHSEMECRPPLALALLMEGEEDPTLAHLTRWFPSWIEKLGLEVGSLWTRVLRAESACEQRDHERDALQGSVEVALRRYEARLPWHARRAGRESMARLREELRGVFRASG